MKQVCRTLILLLCILCLVPGCLSMRLNRAITEYTSDSREMKNPTGTLLVLPAVYGGVTRIGNGRYHLVQVSGALSGDDRLVNMYLPESGRGVQGFRAFMKESGTKVVKGEKAYCVYSVKKNTGYNMFPERLADSNNVPAQQFLKLIDHNKDLHGGSYRFTSERITGISLGPEYMRKINFVILKKGPDQMLHVEENRTYVSLKRDFRYRERSRTLAVLMHAVYVGTVPVDILLSPVYLVYYIIEGPVK